MDQEIKNRPGELVVKIDAIFSSVKKLREYFLVTMWIAMLDCITNNRPCFFATSFLE